MLILFDIPSDTVAQIQALAPGMHIDQMAVKDPGYEDALIAADIIVGWPPMDDLHKAKQLRWLQIASAGANRYVELPESIILTNASGVFGVPIAEHVLAMMLAFTRGIPESVRAAAEKHWSKGVPMQELYGTTCGIIGLGDIGTEVARRAKAFGMRVIATKRNISAKPDFVDELWDTSMLDQLMSESDHVVVTLPGTPHTEHMIDAHRLAIMKQGAFIYNIGRGSVIDEDAMIAHLQSGHLGGAGLDVFAQEPLPTESPLWQLPNVIITPHRAGNNPRHGERLGEIVLRNVPRFLAGERLENVVDRQWGY